MFYLLSFIKNRNKFKPSTRSALQNYSHMWNLKEWISWKQGVDWWLPQAGDEFVKGYMFTLR